MGDGRRALILLGSLEARAAGDVHGRTAASANRAPLEASRGGMHFSGRCRRRCDLERGCRPTQGRHAHLATQGIVHRAETDILAPSCQTVLFAPARRQAAQGSAQGHTVTRMPRPPAALTSRAVGLQPPGATARGGRGSLATSWSRTRAASIAAHWRCTPTISAGRAALAIHYFSSLATTPPAASPATRGRRRLSTAASAIR